MQTLTLDEATVAADRVRSEIDAGRLDDALALAEGALANAVGHPRAVLQHVQALALNLMGRPVDALRSAIGAREGFKTFGSRIGELDAVLAVASVFRSASDYTAALQALEEAETIAREAGDDSRLGIVLRQIGICCSLIGRHQQAMSSLGEAASIHSHDATVREHLNTLLSLYNARNRHALSLPEGSAERLADLDGHLERWSDLATAAAQAGQTRMELMALGNLAITLHDCGLHRDALTALTDLLPRYRAHGMTPNEAICLFEMGRAEQSLGAFDAARGHYAAAVAMFEASALQADLRDALECLSTVEEALGDHRAALAALRRVRVIEASADHQTARENAIQRELRIELARLASQWHRLASIDPLTGLANRRGLEQWFADARVRADNGEPLVILLHDMDHFKAINDRHGHGVGDEVLRRVATLIGANCRANDLAVRYGGEEFLLALMGLDPASAIDVAERLRASIEAFDWSTIAPGLQVTASIGVAALTETEGTVELLTLADRRLYAAKHDGRNRVVHAG